MSGGVDSSVVAGLLAEAGHEVVGATLQLYDHRGDTPKAGACCAGRDIDDARRVADRIGFAHYVIDAEQRFRDSVIADFADSYARGETPVPCVQCNRGVKFTDLLGLARELGSDAMATGHYVRRRQTDRGIELHRARDADRDQSWFLFATTARQLEFLRFPLGEMADKGTVRAHAQRMGLPVAAKPDSQDLCFVPPGASYADLVETLRPGVAGEGDIVDGNGRRLGGHQGIARYTVGQTRRLGDAASVSGARQQVLAIEPTTRRIVVGPRDGSGRPGGSRRGWRLRAMNWLVPVPHAAGLRCAVQLRAREATRAASIRATPDGAELLLDDAALAAPGQACVLYDGERVLGGGFLCREPPETQES